MEKYEKTYTENDLILMEEQEDRNISNEDDYSSTYIDDPMKLYLREISKHPLLTVDEEKKYARDLKLVDSLKLIKKINIDEDTTINSLNLSKVFVSCIRNKDYELVISTLISYYKTKEEARDKEIYLQLRKYRKQSEKLGRALNINELKENFEIDDEETLKPKELLSQTKDFITYKKAVDKMFYSNLRLVVSNVKRYSFPSIVNNPTLGRFDLINEGNMGLMKAIERFDVDRETKFSTYATWWIRQSILRFIGNSKDQIRIPIHLGEEILTFKRNVEKLKQETGKNLSNKEISELLDIPMDTVNNYMKYVNNLISLESPIKNDDDTSFYEMIPDEETDVENEAIESVMIDELQDLMSVLTEKEQFVLKETIGKERTLEQVGADLHVTRERIRQIEASALRKARKHAAIRGYDAYDIKKSKYLW